MNSNGGWDRPLCAERHARPCPSPRAWRRQQVVTAVAGGCGNGFAGGARMCGHYGCEIISSIPLACCRGASAVRKQLHETRQFLPPFFYFFPSLSLSHPLPLLMTTLWPIGMGYAGVGALSSAGPKREGFNGCFTSAQLGSRLCLDVSSRSDGCMCEHR